MCLEDILQPHEKTAIYEWILCPVCGNKTRLKIRSDTIIQNFPLFFPKCKHETLINVKDNKTSVIKKPDA